MPSILDIPKSNCQYFIPPTIGKNKKGAVIILFFHSFSTHLMSSVDASQPVLKELQSRAEADMDTDHPVSWKYNDKSTCTEVERPQN